MFTSVAVYEIEGFELSNTIRRDLFWLLNEIIVSPFLRRYAMHDVVEGTVFVVAITWVVAQFTKRNKLINIF